MSLKVERKEDKVYITYKNPDNEFEPIMITEEVSIKKFEECVQKERKRGTKDPELNTIIGFVLFGENIEC